MLSSSQGSPGASVGVVRSRNVLRGKRLTRSWKLMAPASAMLHNLFSERERRCCTAHRTKISTLCDPDNTFHTNAFSGRFSFLKQHTCQPKKNTTFYSRTLVFARPPVPAPFTGCPTPPTSGLMNLFAPFPKWQFLFDVRLVRLFLHKKTLFRGFVHNFDTALSQIRIFEN